MKENELIQTADIVSLIIHIWFWYQFLTIGDFAWLAAVFIHDFLFTLMLFRRTYTYSQVNVF